MAVSIVYCVEETGDICIDVYDDGVKIVDELVDYPYTNAPTSDLVQCVADLRALVQAKCGEMSDAQTGQEVWNVSSQLLDLARKYSLLYDVTVNRPDYSA